MPTTSALADRQAFLAALARSGLLAPARLAKAAAAAPAAADPATAAAALVAAGFLTRFQADRLLAGRTDGFVIDPYVIQEEAGRGPGGRVFKALHRSMNRTVAVKVLAAGRTRTPDAKAAFRREARAAARLNHPNVVTAYDANERGERAYVVTEYVDGPDLSRLVRERGPLPAAEACEIVRQAAVALEYGRQEGLTHRGIKPTNLLVARASKTLPGCVVKVADFGIARLAAADAAVDTDTQLPTAGDYAAPDAAGDHRADLYSLGCVFYFLLTGRPPFPGGCAGAKAKRHRTEQPDALERLRPDVPPGVVEVVRRLMAKEPDARFPSAAALAARLDAVGGGGAGAVDADGGFVAFDVPVGPQGSAGYHPGYLTGMHPAPVAETLTDASPWAALTDEVRPPRRRGGVSAVALLAVVLSAAAAVALGATLVVKALAR